MKVLFVAGFSPIVQDMAASKKLYVDVLGLPLEGDYPSSERIDGVKHFGLWSLKEAAKACFGKDPWPVGIFIPQANIEFYVDDVEAAAAELERKGYKLLHHAKKEPWGQTICRLLSTEGLLVGLSHTPGMRGSGLREDRGFDKEPGPSTERLKRTSHMMKSRTLSISIERPAAQVYAFASNPDNLSRWIISARVRKLGDAWIMETPTGSIRIRIVAKNEFGVLDHIATLPDGQEILNPIRVVPNGAGSEVVFTLLQAVGMSDRRFAEDAASVEADLRSLKSILER